MEISEQEFKDDNILSRYYVSDKDLNVLGRGQYGVVILATDTTNNKKVVIKKIKRTKTYEFEVLQTLKPECNPFLLCMNNSLDMPDFTYFMFDFIPNVIDLKTLLEKQEIPLRRRLKMAIYLLEGLKTLRKNKIVHRDIKPANIICDKWGITHYIDFGFSGLTDYEEEKCLKRMCFTPAYTLPDLTNISYFRSLDIKSLEKQLYANDIFALGCILYELLLGSRFSILPKQIIKRKLLSNYSLISIVNNIKVQLNTTDKTIFSSFEEMLLNPLNVNLNKIQSNIRQIIRLFKKSFIYSYKIKVDTYGLLNVMEKNNNENDNVCVYSK